MSSDHEHCHGNDDDERLPNSKQLLDTSDHMLLPSTGAKPSEKAVIIGRSRDAKEHPGNKRLRSLALLYLDEYSGAEKDKSIKTELVSSIVDMVNEACPGGAGFVMLDKTGKWQVASKATAREKVGYTFRELLAHKYKSSSKSKVARKRANREGGEFLEDITDADPLDWRRVDSGFSLQSMFDHAPSLVESLRSNSTIAREASHKGDMISTIASIGATNVPSLSPQSRGSHAASNASFKVQAAASPDHKLSPCLATNSSHDYAHEERAAVSTRPPNIDLLRPPAILPQSFAPNFQPSPNTVIIGRSHSVKEHPGNKRLRSLALMYLDDYSKAEKNKTMKSSIVSRIIGTINEACPEGTGFVKLDKTGKWHPADAASIREKVGYTFRDLLADKYRSSSKSKVARNRAIREGGELS